MRITCFMHPLYSLISLNLSFITYLPLPPLICLSSCMDSLSFVPLTHYRAMNKPECCYLHVECLFDREQSLAFLQE
ncbi:unnamed protein product [Albugo candida]|uniref:Uncharacterized protein n=1 Tax=Albugo candida TaxID=65357 RepID=A0A024GN27_9STRA|nr:unnamed protein product [Albugo candida]|eukprot:CCI47754.1 unnamed protein product [Albugo candida]